MPGSTLNRAVCTDAPYVAVMATLFDVSETLVVSENVALVWPAGMVTEGGTLTDPLLDCSITTAPLEGAGPVSVTTPVRLELPCAVAADSEIPASTAGCTVRPALAEHEPPDAEIAAEVLAITGEVETVKPA